MKNKEDITLKIMKRVMNYEKKKIRLWYEITIFVLIVVLLSELFVAFDLYFDIQEKYIFDFAWIFFEDMETIKVLSGSVLQILWEELPWIKIFALFFITVTFVMFVKYFFVKISFKKNKADQVRRFERSKHD